VPTIVLEELYLSPGISPPPKRRHVGDSSFLGEKRVFCSIESNVWNISQVNKRLVCPPCHHTRSLTAKFFIPSITNHAPPPP
jgi:hypothetical protein